MSFKEAYVSHEFLGIFYTMKAEFFYTVVRSIEKFPCKKSWLLIYLLFILLCESLQT